MDHFFCLRHAIERRPGSWQERPALANVVDKGGRHADLRRRMKLTVVKAVQQAELSFADAGRVGEHGLKHRLQLAWRTGDDAQHLIRSLLPLQGFTQLALRQSELAVGLGVGHLRHLRGHGPVRLLTRLVGEFRSLRKRGEWLNGTLGIEKSRPLSTNEQGGF